ncbi:type III restriction protein res subunit [Deinococcus seoulensis]|uniref:Type III restriction protein res subunit n=2 Tax=Deinococcus seoulensis TaxID=1837379 RepID=A0ABQ2RW88_9DEIO|nr:type III restriction protein res subunit [Deinococcus seoulensis]
MAPRKKAQSADGTLFDISEYMATAVCVPKLREAVQAWREGGYKGVTGTTQLLLRHWFHTEHRLPNGRMFTYHAAQRGALETLIYTWEVAGVRTRLDLLEAFAIKELLQGQQLPGNDGLSRLALKMATGSGKTKVMSLAVAWQYFNAIRERDPAVASAYAKSFLVIAPNIIVLERLAQDFTGGRIFQTDPVIPPALKAFWDVEVVARGEGGSTVSSAEGVLYLTNIQQLYPVAEPEATNPLAAMLGSRPPTTLTPTVPFTDRIVKRGQPVMVLNDEAHHTHDENSAWNGVIRDLAQKVPLSLQLDVTATPRFQKGGLFPWVVYDYPLKQAILDAIVKRPVKGITKAAEIQSDIASVRYQAFLTAGVNRWREYREALQPFGKKPALFVMMNTTAEADDVADWLRTKYPEDFGGDGTLVIHTDKTGEVSKKDLETARRAASTIDEDDSPTNAVVSVMMLREGWDVQNVTVVVGLRPYTAKANILPEQAIGRGLRLMFRGQGNGYTERVDIIGNKNFMSFVEDLEKLEQIKLDAEDLDGGKPILIPQIHFVPEKAEYDIALPMLSASLIRKRSIADEVAALDVMAFQHQPLPLKKGSKEAQTFRYEGKDILTLETLVSKDYEIQTPQTAGEVISFYAKLIAQDVKLPSQFNVVAPKIREWFEHRAFGETVSLDDGAVIQAMSSNVAAYVCRDLFTKALRAFSIEGQEPEVIADPVRLSDINPFPWTRPVYEADKTPWNLAPCGNGFEREFAKFLDMADDVRAFGKLHEQFPFSIAYVDGHTSLRYYHPDFVAIDTTGVHWIIETKGAETEEVQFKDRAATQWCEHATALTGTPWRYLKVPQKQFKSLQPESLAELQALHKGGPLF